MGFFFFSFFYFLMFVVLFFSASSNPGGLGCMNTFSGRLLWSPVHSHGTILGSHLTLRRSLVLIPFLNLNYLAYGATLYLPVSNPWLNTTQGNILYMKLTSLGITEIKERDREPIK